MPAALRLSSRQIRLTGAFCVVAALAGCGDGGGNDVRFEALAGGLNLGDGGAATATFLAPQDVAVDAAGNVFVLDSSSAAGSQLVRRVDARSGIITTVAGECARVASDEIPSDACRLHDVAALAAGDVDDLFAVTFDGTVFRFDATGRRAGSLRHLAGRGGRDCTQAAGASALESCIGFVPSITLDARGALYLAEPSAAVRRLDGPSEPFVVIAGKRGDPEDCVGGPSVPDGMLATAGCVHADDIDLDARADLVIASVADRRIRRVEEASGVIMTIAGVDRVCAGERGDGGPAAAACFERPIAVAVGANGDLFVADQDRLRRISAATGTITTVAMRSFVAQLAVAPDGSVVFVDGGRRVSRLDVARGEVTTVAGNGTASLCGEGGPARSACLGQPAGIALAPGGSIYFADGENARIGRIDAASGIVTTVAGGRGGSCGDGGPAIEACFRNVTDVALDHAGNLYAVDRGDEDQGGENDIVGRVRRIDAATGTITTVAGNCSSFDTPRATEACLLHPSVLLFEADGALLVGEQTGVRRIDLATDTISVVAGADFPDLARCTADGIAAAESCLSAADLALDAVGSLYVLDLDTTRVRRVDAATAVVTTVAGNGIFSFCGEEDVPATSTCLSPTAITIDDDGRLIIADGGGFRAVDLGTGRIRTIAGSPKREACLFDAPTPASCTFATDMERDAVGRLIVTELDKRRIQRATLP